MLNRGCNFTIKFISLFILFILSICLVQCVSATDITFEPKHIFISGEKGTIITDTLNVTNNNQNDSIEVTFLTDATGLSFFPTVITIGANKSVDVNVFYMLQTNVTYGNITFTLFGDGITGIVTIDEEGDGEEPPTVQAPVEIFPSPATSGSSLAIYFTGDSTGLSADGFLSVRTFIYRVEMRNGFGIVDLEKDAYGPATLYLFGSTIQEGDSKKEFEIGKGTGKDLNVYITGTATINDDVAATVSYGGDPYGNLEVKVTSPSDEIETYITDNQGRAEFEVNEIGKWRVMVSAEGQMATGSVDVDYGVLPLGIVEEELPQVGDTITIVTDAEAYVEVVIDAVLDGDYIASADGFILLPILKGGRYTLDGKLGDLRGKHSFQVPSRANINILNPTTRMPVDKIESQKRYLVEVTNSAGHLIEDAESLWIANPMGTKELLPLSGGVGTWSPYRTGSYMLSVDDTAVCAGNSKYVLIKQTSGGFGWATGILIFFMIVLAFLCVLLVYSKKRKIPFKLLLGSTFGSLFSKKNKRVDLPIG